MYAVAVRSTLNDVEGAMTFVRDEVVPLVSRAPGVIGGYWVRTAEDQGISLVLFQSEETARAMADRVVPAPSGAATADSVEVGEVVAQI